MNFAPCASPKSTSVLTSLPRSSEPKMMTRPFSFFSASRICVSASRVSCGVTTASAAASLPARNCTKLPSEPGAICANAVACRRSLMGYEFTTYSLARCRRTLVRICQASSGCCSVGLLPISRIAGASKTSRIEAVAFGFAGQRRGESREVGGAMMVNVVGAQHQARELLQQVVLFVAGAVRADDADGGRAVAGQALP